LKFIPECRRAKDQAPIQTSLLQDFSSLVPSATSSENKVFEITKIVQIRVTNCMTQGTTVSGERT